MPWNSNPDGNKKKRDWKNASFFTVFHENDSWAICLTLMIILCIKQSFSVIDSSAFLLIKTIDCICYFKSGKERFQ